jgi:hypothetical protein
MTAVVIPVVPTDELVAQQWIKTVVGDIVGTTRPDASKWADTGFVTVAVVGGTPGIDYPWFQPTMSVDCWATKIGSTKPPWGQAAMLAEAVVMATYSFKPGTVITIPNVVRHARLMEVWPLTHARRVPDDVASFAHYSLDLQMVWVPL